MISPFLLARIDHRLRGLLARSLSPSLYTKIYSASRSWYLSLLAKSVLEITPSDFKPTSALGLQFRNDLGNAAGLDKDGSLLAFNYSMGAGFALVGTVLNKQHTGNLIPSLPLLPAVNPWAPLPHSGSCLNSMGLPSKGYHSALEAIRSFRERYQPRDFPIGISVMGHPLQEGQEKIDGVCEVISAAAADVDFIEINESCPNVSGHDSEGLKKRIAAIAQARNSSGSPVPLVVKFGSVTNAAEIVAILEENGIEGITAVNTQTDYATLGPQLDPRDKKVFDYYTTNHKGGLSGPVINSKSFETARQIAAAIAEHNSKLCLIHVGGIETRDDIAASREFAPLRQWYTGYMGALGTMRPTTIYQQLTS